MGAGAGKTSWEYRIQRKDHRILSRDFRKRSRGNQCLLVSKADRITREGQTRSGRDVGRLPIRPLLQHLVSTHCARG